MPARSVNPELRRLLPSRVSVAVGLGLLAAAGALYFAALHTGIFAVRTLDVRGGTPKLRAEVRQALAGETGRSLMRVDQADLARRLAPVSAVASFTYDRGFPGTLHVKIRREWPVLVLRRGPDAFLVAASGRVLEPLTHPHLSSLPRLWLPSRTQVAVGENLPAGGGAGAATALGALRGIRLPGSVGLVSETGGNLVLVLHSGLELRLGDPGDVRLKLAIVRKILIASGVGATGTGYLDVSVPERPVLNLNPQVGG